MEEDRAANQRSVFSLSFALAQHISNGFGLRYNIYYIVHNSWPIINGLRR